MFSCYNSKEHEEKPVPLYSDPVEVPLLLGDGYKFNTVTGKKIEPIINSLGDTVPTGVPILARGKTQHPDSVLKPVTRKISTTDKLQKTAAHPNVYHIPDYLERIVIDKSSLNEFKLSDISKDTKNHFTLNSTGDTILTGIPIPMQGEYLEFSYPEHSSGLPPRYKDQVSSNIQYYGTNQGLKNSNIRSISQDTQGNLWFGSSGGGVFKFNGKDYYNFSFIPGTSADNVKSSICDKNGNMWFATYGSGIFKYDGQTVTQFSEKTGLMSDKVNDLIEDFEGNMWFVQSDSGLSRFDGTHIIHYTVKEGLASDDITQIFQDSKGNIWIISHDAGLTKFNGEGFISFTESNGLLSNKTTCIIEDFEQNLWIGTQAGLVKFDGQAFTNYQEKDGLLHKSITCCEIDEVGNLWLGTFEGGLYVKQKNFFTHITENHGICSQLIKTIFKDTLGYIWASGKYSGLSKINSKSFSYLTKDDGIALNIITSILEDKQGNLWFGSDGGGVTKYDGTNYINYTVKDGLCGRRITCMAEDNRGNIWFGSRHSGVSKFDGDSFTNYSIKEGLSNNNVWSIAKNRNGDLLIGTYGGGISKFQSDKFTIYSDESGLSNEVIWSILEDSKGNLWFSTDGGGITKFNGTHFTHYTEKEGLSSNTVWDISESSDGSLWLSTHGAGVTKFDGETFTHFTESTGVSNNLAFSTVEDRDHNIWISSEKGISMIQTEVKHEKPKVNNFLYLDGVVGETFFVGSKILDSKNRIWWGGEENLTMLDMNNFSLTDKCPEIVLNQIKVNGSHLNFRGLPDSLSNKIKFDNVERFENYPKNPEFDFDHNHLTFFYSAPTAFQPHKIKYSHIVEGHDSEWSKPSSSGSAEYRNLPFGTFTFKVIATNNTGNWGKTLEYEFTILPPWYSTWLAKLSYLIIAYLIYVGILKWRTGNLRKRQSELLTQVKFATRKLSAQKENVERQKKVIETAHQEITDSIKYAKRIQRAILPQLSEVKNKFPESFVLYEPKDVVAGDFYWMETTEEESFIAVADCTGHGVPGAMVSVVCNNGLNRSVREHNLKKPGNILDKTRQLVSEEFEKSEDDVKDGMDIALCAFHGNKLSYSGANIPLWIISDGQFIETKPSKQPIGKLENPQEYPTFEIELKAGDTVYMFSDGFVDQFGGEKNKKFKRFRLRNLLQSIQHEEMDEQGEILKGVLETWKGENEQVDDVCVIGIRIPSQQYMA